MRGAKGGFWDRLLVRMKQRKISKQKKQKLVEEKKLKHQKEKIIKRKKEEVQILHVLSNNNNFELKSKKRSFRIHKKGISSKVLTYPQGDKKIVKKVVIRAENNKPKSDVIKTSSNTQNSIVKKNKGSITPKIENKKVSTITRKRIIKKKKGISKDEVNKTKDNTKQLNEKSTKLLQELNKIIDDNRDKINTISLQIVELKSELSEARTIKKVEEIEQKLMELKRKLIELMKTYENIKNGSFSKLKNEKIEELMNEIKKFDSNFNFDSIVNKVTPNLDYYNDMSNNVISTVSMIYSSSYQKDIINYKNSEEHNMNVELKDFNELNNRLSNELNKHNDIIKEFDEMISKISPKKIVDVQNDFLSTLLHNTGCLIGTFLSIPFLKKPKNVPLFTFGLFTINNSLRSMRKVTTTEKISYIPSADYANQIIKYKNSFGFVDYMISDSLYQVRELKEEYKINFSSFHNLEAFNKNLEKIESIENKILKQAKEIQILKNKYENTLDKNYQKVLSIKNSNK